jgi:uncharacterized protein
VATILWQTLETGALDRCRLEAGPDGLRLSGIVLTPEHGTPPGRLASIDVAAALAEGLEGPPHARRAYSPGVLEVRYRVEAGPDGLTRRVELELDGGATRRVLLADGAGRWRWQGGPELAEVAGSLDVDLTVTPATNTLPIRRLATLGVGQAADLHMAWVQFPGLEVIPSAQRYQRLAPDRWRFSTGDFLAELLVDRDGLVLDYSGLFRSLAYAPD